VHRPCSTSDPSTNKLVSSLPASLGDPAGPHPPSPWPATGSLSGTIPETLGNLRGRWKEPDLSSCRLTGGIPSVLGSLTRLTKLDLPSNSISGEHRHGGTDRVTGA